MNLNPEPALAFAPELLLVAQPVRALLLDVDGVLTDGGLFFSETGETLKRFDTLDGHGLKLLRRAGITPVVLSGRDSPALRARLDALGITQRVLGEENKLPGAERILRELQVSWPETAAIGDDWTDLPLLGRAAFPCAPPGAHAEVLARARYVTQRRGGQGAVREVCDLLITATGHYARLLREHLS